MNTVIYDDHLRLVATLLIAVTKAMFQKFLFNTSFKDLFLFKIINIFHT